MDRVRRPHLVIGSLLLVALAAGPAHPQAASFRRGDANADGNTGVTDGVFTLNYLFLEGPAPSCLDAADADDNGAVNLADALFLLNFLFLSGPALPEPLGSCGRDAGGPPGCAAFPPCDAGKVTKELYGQSFDVDGAFFVIDRSPPQSTNGELERAKSEVIGFLAALEPRDQFGVVFFASTVVQFPASGNPSPASPEIVAAASDFIRATVGANGTCPRLGLFAALRSANNSSTRRRAIFFLSDGGATCGGVDEASEHQQTIAEVLARNAQRIPIHVFGLSSPDPFHEDFLEMLAATNRGTYFRVNP